MAVSVNGIRQALSNSCATEPRRILPRLALVSKSHTAHGYQYCPGSPRFCRLLHELVARYSNILPRRQQLEVRLPRARLVGLQDRVRLPAEVFRKRGKTLHISIGEPITVEQQAQFKDWEQPGAFLRQKPYELKLQIK